MWSAGQGDNQERFLADLRALRDAAAIGFDELAARAHYPSNILKEAENGPGLPGLPILAAYVRACEADAPEWEERWRRLAYEAQTDPGLPVRPAGASPAAVAGARAGISVGPPDVYDPERIRAALRGQAGSADHAVRDIAQPRAVAPGRTDPDPVHTDSGVPEGPAVWNSRAGWADAGTASWPADAGPGPGSVWDSGSGRGTASGWQAEEKWDTPAGWATPVGRDTARANGNHHATYASSVFDPPVAEEFAPDAPSSDLDDLVAETDRLWPEEASTEAPRWSQDSQLATQVTAESEPGPAQGAGSAGATPAQGAGAAGAVPSQATQPARAPAAAAPAAAPGEPRRDRFFPLRLIAVMVIAAIVGSVLVLVIR
jgi:hypothetical protein